VYLYNFDQPSTGHFSSANEIKLSFSTVWLKVKNKHFQLETKTENYFTKISWNEHLCRFQPTKIIQIDNPKLH
jgi:hypothetical protein